MRKHLYNMCQDVLSRATTGSQTRNIPFGRARVVRYTMAACFFCLQQAFFVSCRKRIYGAHGGTRTPNGLPALSQFVAGYSLQLNYMGIDECVY